MPTVERKPGRRNHTSQEPIHWNFLYPFTNCKWTIFSVECSPPLVLPACLVDLDGNIEFLGAVVFQFFTRRDVHIEPYQSVKTTARNPQFFRGKVVPSPTQAIAIKCNTAFVYPPSDQHHSICGVISAHIFTPNNGGF